MPLLSRNDKSGFWMEESVEMMRRHRTTDILHPAWPIQTVLGGEAEPGRWSAKAPELLSKLQQVANNPEDPTRRSRPSTSFSPVPGANFALDPYRIKASASVFPFAFNDITAACTLRGVSGPHMGT
jgi:hypothetical protein